MRPPPQLSKNGRTILSSVVATQVDLHAQYGGIFPEVASRQHVITIYPIVETALRKAHMDLADVDAISVTRGPGLSGSLVVGVNMAKGLALGSGLPLVGVNHLEAHLYSAWLHNKDGAETVPDEPQFPLLALIVSGGHTELILMRITTFMKGWVPLWMMLPERLSIRLRVYWVFLIPVVLQFKKYLKRGTQARSLSRVPG